MKNFIDDLKVYALNSGALMISFTQVENVLKILLTNNLYSLYANEDETCHQNQKR
jgi:hypothetical protein